MTESREFQLVNTGLDLDILSPFSCKLVVRPYLVFQNSRKRYQTKVFTKTNSRTPALENLTNLMRSLTAWLEDSYCSITVAKHWLIIFIRFVAKNYTHPWTNFTNILHLLLHAYKVLFYKFLEEEQPNKAHVGLLYRFLDARNMKGDEDLRPHCKPASLRHSTHYYYHHAIM